MRRTPTSKARAKQKAKRKPKPKIDKPVAAICHEVRRRREELGLTQEELADLSGLTPNYIGAIELGKRDPSVSSMRSLARGLGISLAELLGPPPRMSDAARKMAATFDHAPEDLQRALLGVLHAASPRGRRT
jgi:transcriptional regulator with XRE-family HTH domain